jgi:hypothetical protein
MPPRSRCSTDIIAPGFGTQTNLEQLIQDLSEDSDVPISASFVTTMMNHQGQGHWRHGEPESAVAAAPTTYSAWMHCPLYVVAWLQIEDQGAGRCVRSEFGVASHALPISWNTNIIESVGSFFRSCFTIATKNDYEVFLGHWWMSWMRKRHPGRL